MDASAATTIESPAQAPARGPTRSVRVAVARGGRPPGPDRRVLLRRLVLGALFLALAVGMVFQDPTKLASHIPGDLGDATLLEWVMRWNVHALGEDPTGIFSPNIYWPTPDTLVYTDTFIPPSLVAGPLRWLFGFPLSFNLLYLANWTAGLASAYVLVRWFTRDTASAVLGSLVFGFAAVRFAHYIHFNHSFGFLVPLTTWLLLRLLTEGHRDRVWAWLAVALGVSSAVLFMSLGYMALALGFVFPIVIGTWLVAERFRPGRRFWCGLGLAAGIALVLCGPVIYKIRHQGDFLTRDFQPSFAAAPSDFLAPALDSYLYGSLDRWADRGHENRLFPGLVALGLAGVGAASVARHRVLGPLPREPVPDQVGHASVVERRRALWALSAGGGLLVLFSFGNYQTVAGRQIPLPYSLVSELGAGFATIRAFGRFFTVSLAVLAIFTGLGAARLMARRSRSFVAIVGTAMGVVMLLEYAGPIEHHPRFDTPEHTAVNHVLDELPPGPVLELPMGNSGGDPLWPFVEGPRMVLSSIDWNPRVNGYSGYASPDHFWSVHVFNPLALTGEEDPRANHRLRQLGISYIVVRTQPMSADYDVAGSSHYTPEHVANLLRALPEEMVGSVSGHGAALLIRLRGSA